LDVVAERLATRHGVGLERMLNRTLRLQDHIRSSDETRPAEWPRPPKRGRSGKH
jgi:hypothetical protein